MASPARPERSRSARSSCQLSRFYHSINPDRVFGTHRSLTVDPDCIEALFGIARAAVGLASTFVDETRWERSAEAEPLLEKVLALAPNNALAHAQMGLVQMNTKRVEAGIAQCEQALSLDHNLANASAMMAYGKQLLGYCDQCENDVKEALRLSPRDFFAFRWMANAGVSKLLLGDHVAAKNWFRRCLDANRNYALAHFHLAAALELSDEVGEARAVARTALMFDPKFTIRSYRLNAASDNPTYLAGRERIYEGMRIAGLPES